MLDFWCRMRYYELAKTIKADEEDDLFVIRIAELPAKCKSFCEKRLERFFQKLAWIQNFFENSARGCLTGRRKPERPQPFLKVIIKQRKIVTKP